MEDRGRRRKNERAIPSEENREGKSKNPRRKRWVSGCRVMKEKVGQRMSGRHATRRRGGRRLRYVVEEAELIRICVVLAEARPRRRDK
jgi:hypothetical protein